MNRKYQAPIPPNTLTNADGTPYSAGHDPLVIEQIKQIAQSALDTGKTWSKEDRLSLIEDDLREIIALCNKETLSQ